MTKVIAFDVGETLLDLSALDRPFEEILARRCGVSSGLLRCFSSPWSTL
jgi:hypothetical protein